MDSLTKEKFARARRQFPHVRDLVWLNSAAYAPFSTEIDKAINKYIKIRMACREDDHQGLLDMADQLRGDFASLVGAAKRQIGLGSQTTYGLNMAAFGLPLPRGSEVLLSDIEFPAAVYTWQTAAQVRGLKIKLVKSIHHRFDLEEFRKSITRNTRALCLSWVQFFNGYKNDLKTISAICKEHGLFFVVDGIQGMGTQPINVRKLGIDIFTSGCQKWMLAPQGGGFFYMSDEIREKFTPPLASWLDVDWKAQYGDLFHYKRPYFDAVRRFEMGYYNVLNIVSMGPPVKMIKDLGLANIQKHNWELIDRLADYIKSNPSYWITSSMARRHRSSIFTFRCQNVMKLRDFLAGKKITVACREGSIRAAVHLFNNRQDIDRLIRALEEYSG